MKQTFFTLCIAAVSLTSACHKAVPVASAPAPVVPVEAPPAKPVAVVQRPSTPTQTPVQTAAQPPRSTTMTPQERTTLNELLNRLSDALFDYDRATIRPDAMQSLQSDVNVIRGILANYPNQKLLIEGHADERGSAEYNLALGDKRAEAAQQFLGSMGIPQTQITIISYGKDRPMCREETEACWQMNRRAHITAQ